MDDLITRWRLILGQDLNALGEVSLNEQQSLMDATLAALYDDTEGNGNNGGKRSAGLGSSSPNLAKWLTDVRSFFPPDVVSVIQSDAIERKGLTKLLFEPETLKNVKPDISMVGTLMALKGQIPAKSKNTARELVKEVVDEIMDIDQSGSMCDSIIYSSVMGSIFASMPALDTHVVVFDTEVTDLTEVCREDPVDMLFGVQLGGGTDINKSVAYCQTLIENPRKTMFILISDLYEGGVRAGLLRRLNEMHQEGVKVLVLLALSDSGRPDYDEKLGKEISKLGIACFACTPDRLPELVENALKGNDLKKFERASRTDKEV